MKINLFEINLRKFIYKFMWKKVQFRVIKFILIKINLLLKILVVNFKFISRNGEKKAEIHSENPTFSQNGDKFTQVDKFTCYKFISRHISEYTKILCQQYYFVLSNLLT